MLPLVRARQVANLQEQKPTGSLSWKVLHVSRKNSGRLWQQSNDWFRWDHSRPSCGRVQADSEPTRLLCILINIGKPQNGTHRQFRLQHGGPVARSSKKTEDAPYESALEIAFQKLSSQVLIFLLAYVILIIGMEVFAGGAAAELRVLLYLIPMLGAGAYVLLEKRKVKPGGVSAAAGYASGSTVEGVRGDPGKLSGPVRATAGFAIKGATVRGVDMGGGELDRPADLTYLSDLFANLDEEGRQKLITTAMELLRERPRR